MSHEREWTLKPWTCFSSTGKIKTVAWTNLDMESLHINLQNGIPVVSNECYILLLTCVHNRKWQNCYEVFCHHRSQSSGSQNSVMVVNMASRLWVSGPTSGSQHSTDLFLIIERKKGKEEMKHLDLFGWRCTTLMLPEGIHFTEGGIPPGFLTIDRLAVKERTAIVLYKKEHRCKKSEGHRKKQENAMVR
ncbi:hypothetical protein Vadar_031160 [Vaccinium darrowii]|uniref:Uncharacterized protein n=1 Tax=Vaccinium darrowii TaxID=229202 RepID=A0ACB7ZMS4_9ERIC|nr:hypothetical protein Vadar_031160 [Vaccinium darrowii]